MDIDEISSHGRGDTLARLIAEDLDPFSVEELAARIAALEAEIVRCRARIDRAVHHRVSADALFRS
ncbi:DUF1192 domain-containing protein [Sphingomonas sp. CFBP 13720]|uniref:DUF1192 domain-containing protein n=1 Tax=Sphingomonas sp. CFBP 13720 TaxID=2775302 RepID=UPI0017822DF0|nr:DUF1192 domain-containing protein [Sphingomonas sp. CFBP 13720]MBD8679372.1 DUF1192 domain-containing protein [Sphingomonas sp. CFBP 13720]